jgi:phi LC3 family holin
MINWKIRFKNPMFYAQLIIAVLTPILAYMGITAQDLTSWGALGGVLFEAIKNPYVLMLVVVSVYNAIIDPTSTGITDSANALTYSTPNSVKE